jgi:hypothetical protein
MCWRTENETRIERRDRVDCEGYDCPEPTSQAGEWRHVSSAWAASATIGRPGHRECEPFYTEEWSVWGQVVETPFGDYSYIPLDYEKLFADAKASIDENARGAPEDQRVYRMYIHSSIPVSRETAEKMSKLSELLKGPDARHKVDGKNPWQPYKPPGGKRR